MSSNLYKRGYTLVSQEETRIIDSNALIAAKIAKVPVSRAGVSIAPPDKDGFSQGLSAQVLSQEELEALTGEAANREGAEDEAGELELAAAAMPEGPTPEEMREDALAEIEQMRKEASAALEEERKKTLEAAKKQGYEEGVNQGRAEANSLKKELEAERHRLEAEYAERIEQLEPQFIELLTGIYEHVIHVGLSDYHDLIVYLIEDALGQIDGGKSIIVHVSGEDYEYVNGRKAEFAVGSASLEVVQDITLSKNQALIETESGIVDCSLGVQLEELGKKLRLLSYEKPTGE
ncbi:MAG: hypothetical protein J1E65_03170 [Lachnospiraceae bacterium]|nr:hypothetical protein [Lachnospiraceae bacterium]